MTMLPDGYRLVSGLAEIDVAATHAYLTRSYWSEGIPFETVERALANSFCVAIVHGGAQVAFARLVTDRATFAYLADVYVLEAHRGKVCRMRSWTSCRAIRTFKVCAAGRCSPAMPRGFMPRTAGRNTPIQTG